MAARVGQTKGNVGKNKRKGRQGRERGKLANKRAREATSDLIDHRLRKALSHELRVQILSIANQREISPSEFSEEFDAPLSNVSYHFRKLLEFDCIELVREVPVRGSHEHRYVGSRRGLISDADWAQLGRGTQAGVRIAGFQDLINRCTQAVEAETFDSRDDSAFYWVPMILDEIGWKGMQGAIRRVIGEVEDFEVESAQRAAEGESETFPATFGILGFESPMSNSRKQRTRAKTKKAKGKDGTATKGR
jgi:DNA-binding transcriptional ArsR family regulator